MYQAKQQESSAGATEPQGQPTEEPAGARAGERKSDDTIEGEFKEQS
jgi:hypothetical protein